MFSELILCGLFDLFTKPFRNKRIPQWHLHSISGKTEQNPDKLTNNAACFFKWNAICNQLIYSWVNMILATWFFIRICLDLDMTGLGGQRLVVLMTEQVITFWWMLINTFIFFVILCTNKSFLIRPRPCTRKVNSVKYDFIMTFIMILVAGP